jgi:uncharacterized integral membrane protein
MRKLFWYGLAFWIGSTAAFIFEYIAKSSPFMASETVHILRIIHFGLFIIGFGFVIAGLIQKFWHR